MTACVALFGYGILPKLPEMDFSRANAGLSVKVCVGVLPEHPRRR